MSEGEAVKSSNIDEINDDVDSPNERDQPARVIPNLTPATPPEYEALVLKWEKARTLLIEVNEQNQQMRAEINKKNEQLRSLLNEFKLKKSQLEEAEEQKRRLELQIQEQEAERRKLESINDSLCSATSGLQQESEQRMAELQLKNEKLHEELLAAERESRSLQEGTASVTSTVTELQAKMAQKDLEITRLTQERAFASSQYESERERSSELLSKLEELRSSVKDLESRAGAAYGRGSGLAVGGLGGGPIQLLARWREERVIGLYALLICLASSLLVIFYIQTRGTDSDNIIDGPGET